MKLTQDEKTFLESYDANKYAKPSTTIDVVLFTMIRNELHVLMVERNNPIQKGKWAIPGGFIDKEQDNMLIDAAYRELQEETGLLRKDVELSQCFTVGSKVRDPRDWVLSVVYMGMLSPKTFEKVSKYMEAADDATKYDWFPLNNLEGSIIEKYGTGIAFDHEDIIYKIIEQLQGRAKYTNQMFQLVNKEFILHEIFTVFVSLYKIINPSTINYSAFRRAIVRDWVEETGHYKKILGKDVKLYKLKRNEDIRTGGY